MARSWYRRLLRLYPRPYRERFGEEMEQAYDDLLREDPHGRSPLWIYAETARSIIREHITYSSMNTKTITRISLMTAGLLAIPLIAMQFTDEVDWNLADFIIIGVLLFGTGTAYALLSKGKTPKGRLLVGIAIGTAFLLIWAELAVGIFGSPLAGS